MAKRVAWPICSGGQSRQMELSITPIHCGVLKDVERSSQQYLVGCGERIDVPLIMWLILGGQRPVIVDVGAGPPDVVEKYQGRYLAQEKSPLDSLAAMGLTTDDIGSVVITHAHWDHVLGLAALEFPQAKIYIQRRELDFAASPLPTQRGLYQPRIVQRLTADAGNDEHQVVAVDGDRDIAPGVKMIHTPGHTPGTSAVLVRTPGGTFAIASDTVALRSSVRGQSFEDWCPPGIHVDLAECYDSMRRLAQDSVFVLPSHDEAVFAREMYQ
jgi:N-acyl homoserine lactone hydrolase